MFNKLKLFWISFKWFFKSEERRKRENKEALDFLLNSLFPNPPSEKHLKKIVARRI